MVVERLSPTEHADDERVAGRDGGGGLSEHQGPFRRGLERAVEPRGLRDIFHRAFLRIGDLGEDFGELLDQCGGLIVLGLGLEQPVQIELGLPLALTGLFQGMLLFFLLACDVLIGYRIRVVRRVSAGGLEPVLLSNPTEHA